MLRLAIAGALVLWPGMTSAQAPTPPRPRNDRASWIERRDYPTMEIFRRAEGITGFELTVGADGRAKSCAVIQSSGSAVLDETTCALVSERARFDPARDAKGRKIQGRYRSRVQWTIPADKFAEQAAIEKSSKVARVPPQPRAIFEGGDITPFDD